VRINFDHQKPEDFLDLCSKPSVTQELETAPDLGGAQGACAWGSPPKRAPHHISLHVFSHMYDMCVPLSHFSEESLFVEANSYIGRPDGKILLEYYLIIVTKQLLYLLVS